jgi:transcriptional regulator with XRE-family HTH domain
MKMEQSKAKYLLRELLEAFPLHEYMDKKKELAKKLGIGRPQLDRLVRGDSDPSGTQLKIMAEFFGCSVDELYKPTPLKF